MNTEFIKSIIIALSLLCAVESRPMSPIAVAAAPLVGGAAVSALIYARNYKNMTFEEALQAYSAGLVTGPFLPVVLGYSLIMSPYVWRNTSSDSAHPSPQITPSREATPEELKSQAQAAIFAASSLSTCFSIWYTIPKALKMAGILKTVTHTITTTSTKWA